MSGDLLFYIAIDTLFLTIVKKLSDSEIVSITSLSLLVCIALQFPILFAIKKIGNTASIKVSAFLLLLSSVFITFGNNYYLILLGRIFRDSAITFQSAMVVALENNLDKIEKRGEFVRIRATANMTYSIITMVISFVVSYMFNFNHYLPMICCVITCSIGFLLSLFMKDDSCYNKLSESKRKKAKVKIHYSKFIISALIVYAVFCTVVANGQSEGKLFIQQNILLNFNVEQTAVIIGAIVAVSRIMRVFSNAMIKKLYDRFQSKLGVALPLLLCTAIACMLFGSFIPFPMAKISVMALGYMIILFARDPFNLYMQDVVLEHTPKEQHQTLLTILEFAVKIASAGIGLAYSAILIAYPMIVVIAIVFAIAVIEIALSLKLYAAIKAGKSAKAYQIE